MELEEVLRMRFPYSNMEPNGQVSLNQILKDRRIEGLTRELLKRGLDTKILTNDGAFRKFYEIVDTCEQARFNILVENSTTETRPNEMGYLQSPIELSKMFSAKLKTTPSEEARYSAGEIFQPVGQEGTIRCSYYIGQGGEFIADQGDSQFQFTQGSTKWSLKLDGNSPVVTREETKRDAFDKQGFSRVAVSRTETVLNEYGIEMKKTNTHECNQFNSNGTTQQVGTKANDITYRNEDMVTSTAENQINGKTQLLGVSIGQSLQLYTVPDYPVEVGQNKNDLTKEEIEQLKQEELQKAKVAMTNGTYKDDRGMVKPEFALGISIQMELEKAQQQPEPLPTDFIKDEVEQTVDSVEQVPEEPQPKDDFINNIVEKPINPVGPLPTDFIKDDIEQPEEPAEPEQPAEPVQPTQQTQVGPLPTDFIKDDIEQPEEPAEPVQPVELVQPTQQTQVGPLPTDFIKDDNEQVKNKRAEKINKIIEGLGKLNLSENELSKLENALQQIRASRETQNIGGQQVSTDAPDIGE